MNQKNDIQSLLQWGQKRLVEAGKTNARQEAFLLLQQASGFSKIKLMTETQTELDTKAAEQYAAFLNERCAGRPLQYILGEWEFMGLPFLVGEGVLIPRADTEILVESVLEKGKQYHFQTGLDIGTGTGCIPISLEKYGNFKMMAVEISPQALAYAQKNNVCNQTKVQFLQSDLYTAIPKETKFDFIVSNPPYIETAEIEDLMEEVRVYEPHNALDGGTDGLDFYHRILEQAQDFLKNDGWIFFEIGCTQRKDLLQLLEQTGFDSLESRQDLAGLDRVVMGRKKGV